MKFLLLLPIFSFSKIFQSHHNTDGKVGIGKIPFYIDFQKIIENFHIPDIKKTIHHEYFTEMTPILREEVKKIQNDYFWNGLCDNKKCNYEPIEEMNELYYSNPAPFFWKKNLYGSAANLLPHRDCILLHFSRVNVYRVIIGIYGENSKIITRIINHNIQHKITQGDYIIFDFDKTMHQVVANYSSELNLYTPRIMLKLHFIVYENNHFEFSSFVTICDWLSSNRSKFIKWSYILYYYIARYTEELGTDPNTFIEYFFGLLWQYPFHANFIEIVCFIFYIFSFWRAIQFSIIIHMGIVFYFWIKNI